MSIVLGKDSKLYYDTDIDNDSWTELTNVKDVSLDIEHGESDVTTRAAGGWTATSTTLKSATIEFEMVWDPDDGGFEAIRKAFFGESPYGSMIGLAIYDGPIGTTGSQGLQANVQITNFSKNEPLNEAATVSVTAKPTYSSTAPVWEETA